MTPIFVDTFYFLALVNAQDRMHPKAVAASRFDQPLKTSMWVLTELADHLCDDLHRHLFGELIDVLRLDPRFEIIPASQATLDSAIDLFRRRPDKSWSLTDCTSFVLISERGITEALTGDHHFEQAGFKPLLK